MKSKILHRLIFLLALIPFLTFGQENATGLILDDDAYDEVLLKAPLVRGLYTTIPTHYSLKQYTPYVGNQNPFGTCVGWSVSYAARTILWAKENNIRNKTEITRHAFSPGYIYRNIVQPTDYPRCNRGASIAYALKVMKQKGVPLFSAYDTKCPADVPYSLNNKAKKFKIDDYARLFGRGDSRSTKIKTTKKALAEGNPIVIGMVVPRAGKPSSFNYVKSGLWTPTSAERNASGGGHAMCVIGYDDNKYGGAFEIMNSWGSNWGSKGFFWIRYQDYALFTKYAFELIQNIKPKPKPKPVVVNPPKPKPTPKPSPKPKPAKDFDFAGDLRIVFDNGQPMPITIQEVRGLFVVEDDNPPKNNPNNFKPDPNLTTGKFSAYRANRAYSEGTRFRVYLKNSQPAYVYMIAMDGTNRAVQIFPHKPNISPILNYANSEIALPSESAYVQLDNVRGKDILCLLYSKEPLDIPSLNKKLEQATGTFFQRLYKTMRHKLVPREYLRYYNERMRFEIKSNGKGSIVPIVLEIPHN